MKLAPVLALLVGCGGSSKAPEPAEPVVTSSPDPVPAAMPAAGPPPATQRTEPAPASVAPPPAPATTSPAYSCFSYTNKASTVKRHSCMRTADCATYLEQAKAVGSLRDFSGCATVEQLYCFHQAPSKVEPDGLDVCQPTLADCKQERATLVKAGTSVDSDCTTR